MGQKAVKCQDWEGRLESYLEKSRPRKFEWGAFDCCTFASGAVLLQIGIDPMNPPGFGYAGRPRTIVRFMRTLENVIARQLREVGLLEVLPLRAQRGDVVLGDTAKGRPFVGVVGLDGWQCFAPGTEHLESLPLSTFRRAWRVE